MTRSPFMLLILAALLAVSPSAAAAQRRNAPPPRPELFQALLRCRAVADEAERLRCFDTAAAALETAAERREVVMVDRAQVREGRRRLFGLALPRIPIFGGGDDDEPDEDRIETVEGVVASASQNGQGQWIVALQDGAVWTQIDNRTLALFPRRGQRVVIQRAAMGSFMMRINNQPGVRARRIR
jgi:hypothetical protein